MDRGGWDVAAGMVEVEGERIEGLTIFAMAEERKKRKKAGSSLDFCPVQNDNGAGSSPELRPAGNDN